MKNTNAQQLLNCVKRSLAKPLGSITKNEKSIISLSISLLILTSIHSQNEFERMKTDFESFRTSIVNGDCIKSSLYCHFPIRGDVGYYRMFPDTYDTVDTGYLKKLDRKVSISRISRSRIIKKITWSESQTKIEYDGCIYSSDLEIDLDSNSFIWSVGCQKTLDGGLGEFSTIFWFEEIKWSFQGKLTSITGAG